MQDGAYVNQANSLLTYVAQVDPIWVNFSMSENDVLKYRGQAGRGQIILPKHGEYEVEILLGDGSIYPKRGRIFFADAEYNPQTGTFLVRSTLPNPDGVLRPGQFVRAHVLGAMRPKAILVPQRAVQQGAKGHFVWVVSKENKAEQRPVVVGDWQGNNWFITEGLKGGEVVVVDGGLSLQAGAPVKIKSKASAAEPRTGRRRTESRRRKNRSRQGRQIREGADHVLQVLHRASYLRYGRLANHCDRRTGGDGIPAGRAVPDDHAGHGPGDNHLSRRRLQDRRRLGGGAHRGPDQRRRQHALHDIDQFQHGADDDNRLLHAEHGSRHGTGVGAEPRQPCHAAATRSR